MQLPAYAQGPLQRCRLFCFVFVDRSCRGEEEEEEEELVIEKMTLRERESLSDIAAEEKKNL